MSRELPNPLPQHITAKMAIGRRLQPIDPNTGRAMKRVAALHTGEGWVEEYELAEGADELTSVQRVRVADGSVAPPVRRYCDFNLVDKVTGETVAYVRQNLDRKPDFK